MKVDSKVLSKFLDKVTIGGDGVKDGVVNFSEEGFSVTVLDSSNTVWICGKLKKELFKDYKPLGKVAIANFNVLKGVVSRYSEEMEVSLNENVLVFSSKNREFEVVLPDLETVSKEKDEPKLEYVNVLKLESSFLKEAVKNADTLEKGLGVTFLSKEDKLVAECGNDDRGREIVEVEGLKEDLDVKFGEPFRKVVSVLDGSLKVSLKSDYPVKVEYSDTEMELKFIVASMER